MQSVFRKKILDAITFILIFAGFAFILTMIPLLPLGLPIFISFLIAFATFKSPMNGISLGSLLIAISLTYYLAKMNFMYIFGEPYIRALFVLLYILFFVAISSSVRRREDAIPIAIGTISAGLLFFKETFFLAIPLILVFATIYKKARLGIAISCYILISLPLEMLQYLNYGSQTGRPPLYVPLDRIFVDLHGAMTQFTFDEIFGIAGTIIRSIITQDSSLITSLVSIRNYLNSFPGIVIFFLILSGLVSATALFISYIAGYLKQIERIGKNERFIESIFSIIAATSVIFIFWMIVDSLQYPLNFEAQVSSTSIAYSILGTIGIMLPISIGDHLLRRKEIREARSKVLAWKAEKIWKKINEFEKLLKRIKDDLPIVLASIERRVSLLKEDINRIVGSSKAGLYSLSEIDEKINEIDNEMLAELDALHEETNRVMEEYYARAYSQHQVCVNKLRDLGLETEGQTEIADIREFHRRDIDSKIDLFKKMLDAGYSLANEALQLFNKVYAITRSLYDPKLPSESPTIVIVKQKIEEKANPWEIIDAIYVSLYNLEKQYSAEVSKSIERLRESLNSISNLITYRGRLIHSLDNFNEVLEYAGKASSLQISFEAKEFNVMKVVMVKEALDSILEISKNLLSIFYSELKKREEMITGLLPLRNYEWGKNVSLHERMEEAIKITSNPSNYEASELISTIHQSLSYFEECIETLDLYSQEYEFLLNYATAESFIDELLRRKKNVYARELPFKPRYSAEYLRIYFRKQPSNLLFDEENIMIIKRS